MRLSFLFLCLLLLGCKKEVKPDHTIENLEEEIEETVYIGTNYSEKHRPQFHFSPQTHWMNDPNGLIFYKDTYHLFYQYYPEDIVWGPMHWGHATSTDLISWKHKPIALFPDEIGYIFSGSAVMDLQNTSGLGTSENPPMIAIFTYHNMEGEKNKTNDFQTQGIAFSLDEGNTWTKYKDNPVIDNSEKFKDFRDPKVMWHEASKQWIMTLVAGDHTRFYGSPNLTKWEYLSSFGKDQGAHGGVWECPDLFELKVEGADESKWVLLVSMNPGAPNGGSGTQYFVGDFDGKIFTSAQEEVKWLDYGSDNYAGITYNGLAQDNRTFIGWMSNWNYAQKTPTEVWRSSMTLPRKLTLHKSNGYLLKNVPVTTIENYESEIPVQKIDLSKAQLLLPQENQLKISFELKNLEKDFFMTLVNEQTKAIGFGYEKDKNMFYVDRRYSGDVDFEPAFADKEHYAPNLLSIDENIKVTMYLDHSSLEVFVDNGTVVMTEQYFATHPFTRLSFVSSETAVSNLKISTIKSIW